LAANLLYLCLQTSLGRGAQKKEREERRAGRTAAAEAQSERALDEIRD